MKTLIAPIWLCLFVLPLLASCLAKPVATKPVVVDVAKITYAPMPAALTDPIPEPPLPPQRCVDKTGAPAWCLVDVVAWIEAWRSTLKLANDDRASTAKIGVAVQKAVQP